MKLEQIHPDQQTHCPQEHPKSEFPAATYFQVHFQYLYEQLEELRNRAVVLPSGHTEGPSAAYVQAQFEQLNHQMADLRNELEMLKRLLLRSMLPVAGSTHEESLSHERPKARIR
jgi:hypothetical protein